MEVRDEVQVGAVRRAVHTYAGEMGFTEREQAEIDIVVQELGTNAARYAAGGGWIHFTKPVGAEPGLEIFYWDKGPGIPDIGRAARDGVSTGGSLGGGLGAMRRLMDEFEVYSTVREPGRRSSSLRSSQRRTMHGTAILCRKWVAAARLSPQAHATTAKRLGVWSRPVSGEDLNGDAYFVRRRGARMLLAVIDGLGHGQGAHAASQVALEVLGQWQGEPLEDLFRDTHEALRTTRGAVMGAALIDTARGTLDYAGVGNIEVRILNAPEPARPLSHHGTLGARMERFRVWSHKWAEGTLVIMASDGLSATWDLADYPELPNKSLQMIAGVLMRDYERDSDDATILIAR